MDALGGNLAVASLLPFNYIGRDLNAFREIALIFYWDSNSEMNENRTVMSN